MLLTTLSVLYTLGYAAVITPKFQCFTIKMVYTCSHFYMCLLM